MSGFLFFIILVIIVAILAFIVFYLVARIRAKRQGLPPPPLSAFNPFNKSSVATLKSKFSSFRRGRHRDVQGGYESTTRGGRSRGMRDEEAGGAWDSHLGRDDPLFEEQELGLAPDSDVYARNAGYSGVGYGYEQERGRSREAARVDDNRSGRTAASNPFGDEHETGNASLRSVSPRPIREDDEAAAAAAANMGDKGKQPEGHAISPRKSRSSLFHEDMS